MSVFIVLIGPETFEGIIDIPDDIPERVFEEKITGADTYTKLVSEISSRQFAMEMRARLNTHRKLDVFLVEVEGQYTPDEFAELCVDNITGMYELISNTGKKLT